jgi:hypothetical protein
MTSWLRYMVWLFGWGAFWMAVILVILGVLYRVGVFV